MSVFEQNVADFKALLTSNGYSAQTASETALTYYLQSSGMTLIRGDINNTYSSANWLPLSFNASTVKPTATACP